jgi:hypothetical protein
MVGVDVGGGGTVGRGKLAGIAPVDRLQAGSEKSTEKPKLLPLKFKGD